MKTVVINESKAAAEAAADVLKKDGIVAFPTDTVYGLGARYTSVKAVKKIFEAKGRDEGKPLSILIGDMRQIDMLSDCIPEKARKLMDVFWPGALTVIVKKNDTVPKEVAAGGSTVGIRMPASDIARDIISKAGEPLATPSANITGKRSSVSAEDVKEDLFGKIDMIVDGGECKIGLASTVVDVSGDDLIILREGSITWEQIEQTING